MDSETSAFTFTDSQPKALDLCMAPGGFLAYFFHKSPAGVADAITLPEEEGGHQVLLSLDGRKAQINVVFADVTMYAAELGERERKRKRMKDQGYTLFPIPIVFKNSESILKLFHSRFQAEAAKSLR